MQGWPKLEETERPRLAETDQGKSEAVPGENRKLRPQFRLVALPRRLVR
jgi:hypothetical protein